MNLKASIFEQVADKGKAIELMDKFYKQFPKLKELHRKANNAEQSRPPVQESKAL